MVRFANHQEIKNWNILVAKNPDQGHIYQSREWGDFKAKFGWQPVRIILDDRIAIQLLKKAVPFAGNIYYCPKGPGIFESYKKDTKNVQLFKQFTKQIKDFILQNDKRANLIKIEPELLEGELDLSKLGYQKSPADLQFKATIVVDISQKEEEILSDFKQKTRYNINLAKKRGVTVEFTTMDEAGADLMYRLMRSTQKRAGFFLRKKTYFKKYCQDLAQAKMGQLLIAKYQNHVLAGVFATIFNK
ncbi:MAG: peptidoglycan bridge formation glycyltransferase FemA/FemB family protein, partial [bacterium]|nr:peptidoglycan bridge formation glycyltransferase FemA/FemB family protein [bacterium]